MELLIQNVERAGMTRGDIVDVKPDMFDWGGLEYLANGFIVVALEGAMDTSLLEGVFSGDGEDRQEIHRRRHFVRPEKLDEVTPGIQLFDWVVPSITVDDVGVK